VARPSSEILTEREAQIMDVLWEHGAATAEQVRAALPDQPHDSTVRTLLRVLEAKGQVKHAVQGKAYVYRARVPRARAQRKALRSVLTRFFRGSAEDLILRLVEDEAVTPEQLEAIRRAAASERRGRGFRKEGRS
jgi:predicted transcriptional regulator